MPDLNEKLVQELKACIILRSGNFSSQQLKDMSLQDVLTTCRLNKITVSFSLPELEVNK